MRTRRAWWSGAAVLQLGAVIVTAYPPFTPGLGVPVWHHNAALLGAVVLSGVFWKRMTTDRRFLGIGVLVTTALAILSAFALLYLKDDLKASGLKDWAKWWHVAWSWFALVFFLGHTWVNRTGLARSLRRMVSRWGSAALYVGILVAILVSIPLTWSRWGAENFQDSNYIRLTLYTWLLMVAPSYGAWGLAKWRIRIGRPLPWSRGSAPRAFTDSWLLPMTVLANVSGFPILYFGTKDTSLKYVAKYWHTWPSIAMAILVFAHTIQFLPGVTRYFHASKDDSLDPAD